MLKRIRAIGEAPTLVTPAGSLMGVWAKIDRLDFYFPENKFAGKKKCCVIELRFQWRHCKCSDQIWQLKSAYKLAKKALDENYSLEKGDFVDEKGRQHLESGGEERHGIKEGLRHSHFSLFIEVLDKRYAAILLNVVHDLFDVSVDAVFDRLKINRVVHTTQSYIESFLEKGNYEGALRVAQKAQKIKGSSIFYDLGKHCQSVGRDDWAVGFYQNVPKPTVLESEKVLYQKANRKIFHILQSQKQVIQDGTIEGELTEEEKIENLAAELGALLHLSQKEQDMIDHRVNESAGFDFKPVNALTFRNVRADEATVASMCRYIAGQNKEIKALKAELVELKARKNCSP